MRITLLFCSSVYNNYLWLECGNQNILTISQEERKKNLLVTKRAKKRSSKFHIHTSNHTYEEHKLKHRRVSYRN